MKGRYFYTVVCASAMLLAGVSAFADDAKCRDAFYKANRNVGNQEQKNNRKACVKDGGGEACVAAEGAKAADKRAKIQNLFLPGAKCVSFPAFGVNTNQGMDFITGGVAAEAIERGTDTIIRDIFGDPISGIVAGDKCQDAVAKRTGKIYDTILKGFRKCNKDTLPADQNALDACVSTASNDPKVTTFAGKLLNDVTNQCASSAPIVPGSEDGLCSGATDAASFRDCALARTRCNACTAINVMTTYNFSVGNANCDLLDNGVVDLSCSDATARTCAFNELIDNSNLQLFAGGNTDLSSLVTDIAGAIDITCDPETQDINGKRLCKCELQTWATPQITGIGFICIEPAAGCPVGEQDCDGGNALAIDAEDSSQIGACTTHAGCSAACDTHCNSLGKVQWRSGCENLCQGGSRDSLPCICDLVGNSGCVGGTAGVDDCPDGSCVGKNNEADQDCQCQCIDYTAGGAGPAGALQCNLGVDIKVVAALPCTQPTLVDLPPICAPFSSQSTTGETNPANEGTGGGPIGPNTLNGSSETCANFDASFTTGYTLVGDFGFMDSTIGDVRTPFTVDCQ